MTMPEHSPEPWVHAKYNYSDCVVAGPIVDGNNMLVVDSGPAATVEDFDRIVACVNALRGLNPEVVPDLVEFVEDVIPMLMATQRFPDLEAHAKLAEKMARALLARVKG